MSRVIKSLIPPDGWHYMQEGKFRIDSDSYDNLIEAVSNWRVQNGRPQNNVEQDIIDQTCQRAPTQCHKPMEKVEYFVPKQQVISTAQKFVDRISSWANAMRRNPAVGDLTLPEEAERRAAICIQCPRNTIWRNSCGNCMRSMDQILFALRQLRDVSNGSRLSGCSSFGHDNRTAVWFRKDCFKPAEGIDVPHNCWLKQ